MKKIIRVNTLLIPLTIFMMIFQLPLFAEVSGPCANCHIMHNSQDGKAGSVDGSGSILLRTKGGSPCIGCHAQGISESIDPVTGAPQVRHSGSADLAGGNFAYLSGDKAGVNGNNMSRGHNIIGLGQADDNFSGKNFPPGDEFSQSGGGFTSAKFTCAGKFGCHGDRTKQNELEAIAGSHHAKDSALKFGSIDESAQGNSVGTSYRFLLGVKGGEDSDWERTADSADHNEYKGAVDRGTESTKVSPGGNTISGFCAECHGGFHGPGGNDVGANSVWLRHPVDIALPGTGEFADYNSENSNSYSIEVPLAKIVIPGNSSALVSASSGKHIVMCLSCHRAHASPYEDSLRWNYAEVIAGGGGSDGIGCFVCHTKKDGK